MSSKEKRMEKKRKEDKQATIIAIVFGGVLIGIVIGVLASGLIRGSDRDQSDDTRSEGDGSGVMAESGVLVDYQEQGLIDLGDYKGKPISLAVTEEDIEIEMDFLVSDNTEQLDGPAKEGDMVNVDFVGKIDGQEFEDGSAEDMELKIGAGDFIEGLDGPIVGMKSGETKDIEVTFPEDYGDEELDGKDAVFTLTLNYVMSTFDDAFVQKISNGEYQTVEDYKEYMKEYLYEENMEYKPDTYWDTLLEEVEVTDVDEGEYNKAVKEATDMYANFEDASGESVEDMGMDDQTEEIAYDVAVERMIAKTVAKIENLEMSDDFYHDALYKELDDEEFADMSTQELEDEYWSAYATDPKDDMLVYFVKDYLAETAEVVE